MSDSKKQHCILIVDDEPDILELLTITLSRMGIDTRSAMTLTDAKEALGQNNFSACLTDMKLPDGSGIELVEYVQNEYPDLPIAVITAFGSIEAAIESLKAGAFDFVNKPIDLSRLRELVSTALKIKEEPIESALKSFESNQLIGESDVINSLRLKVKKLARSQAPVYISGESGSGKEVVAKLIHELGPRSDKNFIAVNCGAIPSELMESEFFGHLKGSFTGANSDKDGLFHAAHGGTLFLDEVADLPLSMQVKLLRVIQEKSMRAIGASKEEKIDVRILSATHKDLAQEVEDGRFRQDLFYRINVIQLHTPALRERQNDIPLLANYFIQKIAHDWQIESPTLSKEAQYALEDYAFPGNVRELENTIVRALTLCEGDTIEVDHLQLSIKPTRKRAATVTETATTTATATTIAKHNAEEALLTSDLPLEEQLYDIEKNAILKALNETRWNRTEAAKKLGMSFRSLRYRLKKLGLDQTNSEDLEP